MLLCPRPCSLLEFVGCCIAGESLEKCEGAQSLAVVRGLGLQKEWSAGRHWLTDTV